MSDTKQGDPRVEELEATVRDLAFALEVICSRIKPDAETFSGHEFVAYQALVKHPEWVKSRRVRALVGVVDTSEVSSEPKTP